MLMHLIAAVIAFQAVHSDSHLQGRTGTLKPDVDLDEVIFKDNKRSEYVNSNILSINFDNNCGNNTDTLEEIIDQLLDLYPCLSRYSNEYLHHGALFHLESKNAWFCYLTLDDDDTNSEDNKCIDDVNINYDDYCISGIHYAATLREDMVVRDYLECHDESTSFWHLDILDGVLDNNYNHLDTDNMVEDTLVDMFILDRQALFNHEQFSDLTVWGFNDVPLTHFHGTAVGSLAVGNTLGVNHAGIRNVYFYPLLESAWRNEATFIAVMESIINILENSSPTRKGVLVMSFGIFDSVFDAETRENLDEYLLDVINAGGYPITSSGNDGIEGCVDWPETSIYTVNVGAYNEARSLWSDPSEGSNYGSCVHIYAPGEDVIFASTDSTTDYGIGSGTSASTPIIAGIVSQMLSLNSYLSFWQIREILQTEQVSFEVSNCPSASYAPCRGIQMDCNLQKLISIPLEYTCPYRSPSATFLQGCASWGISLTLGFYCKQCDPGYFKLRQSSAVCHSCSETFGGNCLHCSDYIGCQQCASGTWRDFDESCDNGLYYCFQHKGTTFTDNDPCPHLCLAGESDVCKCWEINNCAICHNDNSACEQCESGYFYHSRSHHCEHCQTMFGNECRFCQNYHGCGQCVDGYIRVYDNECGLYKCQPQ